MVSFENEREAEAWLHKEEYDFRERELVSESRAIELMGEEAFDSWNQEEKCRF